MTLLQLSRIANKPLQNFLFGLIELDLHHQGNFIQTFGDIDDLVNLVKADIEFHLHELPYEDSPLNLLYYTYHYMNHASYFFTADQVRQHLSNRCLILNEYPNIYHTMEIWIWS